MTAWLNLLAVYFVIWWVVLFAVLPFGVRTQDEADETILGTHGSAPTRPMMLRKALITTVISAVIMGALVFAHDYWGLTVDSIGRWMLR
ncbi:MAG: DUF1467 family protein [Bauldia sp.]